MILKDTGDWVDTGEILAHSGDSGGLNKPALYFEVGRWNGYGGEYYVARSYSPESFIEGKKYKERIKNTEKISSGRFVIFFGNKIGRVINREERKYGKLRACLLYTSDAADE